MFTLKIICDTKYITDMSTVEKESILCHSCGLMLPNKIHNQQCSVDFMCSKCNKIFSTIKYLNQHSKTHFERAFKCSFCEKHLRSKQNLQEHINMVHNSCLDYNKCTLCDSKFKRKSDLKRHQMIHSHKLFVCPTCNKQFHFKFNLDKHTITCNQ